MLRFVILEHDHPYLHWDLLLEHGEVLRAWRLLAQPHSAAVIDAEPLPDHRRLYLDYEGPVGGDRGSVTKWDAGTFEIRSVESNDSRRTGAKERIAIDFAGNRLRGAFVLACETDDRWRFHSPPDPHR